MPPEQLADLLTAPTGDEKSYRQLVRESHHEPSILMLVDREHFLLTRAVLDRIEADGRWLPCRRSSA